MSTLTGKDLNLVKPALTDDYKVTIGTDLPANFQKIDDEFSAHLADYATQIANRVKKDGDTISGIIGMSKTYYNVFNIYHMGVISNGIKIKTGITTGSNTITTIEIIGYSGSVPVFIIFQFYLTPNLIINNGFTKASSINSFKPEIKVAIENGELIIFIGGNMNYPAFDFRVKSPVPITEKWTYVDGLIDAGATSVSTCAYV